MVAGSAVVAADTLIRHHIHQHEHVITHEHGHDHYSTKDRHGHHHSKRELDEDLSRVHSILHVKA